MSSRRATKEEKEERRLLVEEAVKAMAISKQSKREKLIRKKNKKRKHRKEKTKERARLNPLINSFVIERNEATIRYVIETSFIAPIGDLPLISFSKPVSEFKIDWRKEGF